VLYEEETIYLKPGDWLFFHGRGFLKMLGSRTPAAAAVILKSLIGTLGTEAMPARIVKELGRVAAAPPSGTAVSLIVEMLSESRKIRTKEMLGFNRDDQVYVQYISYYEEMEKAAAAVLRAMDSFGYRDEDIRKMKIVMNEILANAIGHGNRDDHSKKVALGHKIDGKSIEVAVMDEGEGFDPCAIPDPTLPENLGRDRGRGLYIVRKYVDTIEFNARGNRIKIRKKHHCV
jgi:serine/threonine-protein kinase RsbW